MAVVKGNTNNKTPLDDCGMCMQLKNDLEPHWIDVHVHLKNNCTCNWTKILCVCSKIVTCVMSLRINQESRANAV